MNTREPRDDSDATRAESIHGSLLERPLAPSGTTDRDLEREVEYIVDDCFFTVGQVVGMRMTVDYDAVTWWRDHYRATLRAARPMMTPNSRSQSACAVSAGRTIGSYGPVIVDGSLVNTYGVPAAIR